MPESLANSKLIKILRPALQSLDNLTAKFPGIPRGSVRAKIIDVDDPQERGRVRVLFDAMNPEDIPQFEGAVEYSLSRDGEMQFISHWIDSSPAFKGKQPQGLINKRVNVVNSNNQYHYAILQDVLHDPELLTAEAAGKLEFPNNSSMTRLPVYGAGGLPPACAENHGCVVIESDGPMLSDWLCVCLRRNGNYHWVRHVDLAHGHAGQNDSCQLPDTSGDGQQPIKNLTVWDAVFPTTDSGMPYSSQHGTEPRPNPYGSSAKWYGGAK